MHMFGAHVNHLPMRPPGITRSRVVKRAPGRRPAHDRRLRAERRARVAARPDHRPLRPRVQDRRATRAVAAELKSRGAEADSVSFRTPRRQPCAAEARLVGVEHQELPERAGGSRPARGRSLIRLAPAVIVVFPVEGRLPLVRRSDVGSTPRSHAPPTHRAASVSPRFLRQRVDAFDDFDSGLGLDGRD
jgi:hypothetical protein